MAQTDKVNNFITRSRQEAELLLSVYGSMNDLRDEYTKLGYSEQSFDDAISATPEGDNSDLTGAMVVALMTSIDNLVTYMNAGNGTNLYHLKR